jgi:hypothetical protein
MALSRSSFQAMLLRLGRGLIRAFQSRRQIDEHYLFSNVQVSPAKQLTQTFQNMLQREQ